MTQNFSVVHSKAETQEQRDEFKGSKYIQSNMENILLTIEKDLKENQKVLFSGTPCQVAAVTAYIKEPYRKNLYTCDLICHGVPSELIFQKFLQYIEKTNKKHIQQFIFRDKRFGWESHYETFIFEDGTEMSTQYFRNLFYGHNILRPSCHTCNYANAHRPADITIADFWGIEEVNPAFLDKNGVSLVILNNEKGKELFDKAQKDLTLINCSIEDCIKHTYTLTQPTPENPNRTAFWQDFRTKKFEEILEKYGVEE